MTPIKEIRIPVELLQPYNLTLSSKYLYGVLLWHSYNGKCYCTNKTLSDEVGVSIRTIQNSLKELETKKVVLVEFNFDKKLNCDVRYITPLVIEKIRLVDERKIKNKDVYNSPNYDITNDYTYL